MSNTYDNFIYIKLINIRNYVNINKPYRNSVCIQLTCIQHPGYHAWEDNDPQRQKLEVAGEDTASLGVGQILSRQSSLYDHLENIGQLGVLSNLVDFKLKRFELIILI